MSSNTDEEEAFEAVETRIHRWSDVEMDISDEEEMREAQRNMNPTLRSEHIIKDREKERAVRKIILALTMIGDSATASNMFYENWQFKYNYTTMLYLMVVYEQGRSRTSPAFPLPALIQDHIRHAKNPEAYEAYYQRAGDQNMKPFQVPCLIEDFPFPDSILQTDSGANFMSWSAYQEIRWTTKIVPQSRQGILRGLSGRHTIGTITEVTVTLQGHRFLLNFQILANKRNKEKEVIFGKALVEVFRGRLDAENGSILLHVCGHNHHYLRRNIHLPPLEHQTKPELEWFFEDLGDMGQRQQHILGWDPPSPHRQEHAQIDYLFRVLRKEYHSRYSYNHFLDNIPYCVREDWSALPPRWG